MLLESQGAHQKDEENQDAHPLEQGAHCGKVDHPLAAQDFQKSG